MRTVWVLPHTWHRFKVLCLFDGQVIAKRWFVSEHRAEQYAQRMIRG